jgi:hypothetical protein
MTFALAIPHCPWLSERVQTLNRLKSELGPHDPAFVFGEREPNWSWSGKLWQWGLDTGADYLVQLQDDCIVDGQFWQRLQMMVDAVPDQIIGLETAHPLARHLYETGHQWCTTADGLIGVGYVLPRAVLAEFMAWRSKLPETAVRAINEDTLIDVWAYTVGRKVWHPLPTIIDHDTQVRSVYANDHHPNRRPVASTIMGDLPKGDWSNTVGVRHLGLFYGVTVPTAAQQLTPGLMRVDDQTQDVRLTISEMVAASGPVKVCMVCGINAIDVNGPTGLGMCRTCIAVSVRALLGVR